MAAPDYVPVPLSDQPRRALDLPPPRPWMADRPGDLDRGQPLGPKLGRPGPDQGYALKLADIIKPKVKVGEGEHVEDALAGAVAVALKRASLFGRAPVMHDLELALRLWGFLDENPPEDLVELRKHYFAGASHHYWDQRLIPDVVPESTLRLTPAQVAERLSDWRSLLSV
ncbi:MAG TPA: hypothetical protein VHF24_07515 [Acidimicrobiales bacterium]|jgi:hypothetical protein|nr:hypothetical protein [Acidimicrobiales bacterium]